MLKKSLMLLFSSLTCLLSLDAAFHPKQENPYFYERKFEPVEAFDKIYVQPTSILYMPDGTYLKHDNGEVEKVLCPSQDANGTYIVRIQNVCNQCGRIYSSQDSSEGWCCHLHEKQIRPSIWIKPY